MSIRREIEVTRKGLPTIIDVTYGTDLLALEFKVTDYIIPTGAAAVAYNQGQTTKIHKQICNINDNTISFTPEKGFFEEGHNEYQIRVVYNDRSLFSYKGRAKCHSSFSDDDATEAQKDTTLIEQVLTEYGEIKEKSNEVLEKMDENKQYIAEMSSKIELHQQILKPTSELQFNRNFRVLKERYKYGTDEHKALNETNAYSLQSMTCYNGNVILGYVNGDDTIGTLEERMYDGTLVKSANFENGELGHANGMTSYNGKIYVATLDKIAVIDYNSFAYEGTIDFGVTLNSIAYDKIKNKWYGLKNKSLYSLDLATRKSTLLYNLEDLGGTYQSICVHNDVVYVSVAKPNLIIIFHKGKRIVSYNIARYFDYDYFGETQDIEIVDGTMYITSQWLMHKDNYYHDTVWNVDLNNNYTFKPRYADNYVNSYGTIYCNSASEDMTPNGLPEKPFKTLSECINALMSPLAQSQGLTDINLTGDFNEVLYVRGLVFRLIGSSSTNRPNILCGAELESARVYCQSVYFNNQDPAITSTVYIQNGSFGTQNTAIDTMLESQNDLVKASYSEVKLHANCLKNTGKVTRPIFSYFSNIVSNVQSVIDSVVEEPMLYRKES